MDACSIEGCCDTIVAKGLCAKHYMRRRRNGDPTTVRKRGPQPGWSRLSAERIGRGFRPEWSVRTKARFAKAQRVALWLYQRAGVDPDELLNAAFRNGPIDRVFSVSRYLEVAIMRARHELARKRRRTDKASYGVFLLAAPAASGLAPLVRFFRAPGRVVRRNRKRAREARARFEGAPGVGPPSAPAGCGRAIQPPAPDPQVDRTLARHPLPLRVGVRLSDDLLARLIGASGDLVRISLGRLQDRLCVRLSLLQPIVRLLANFRRFRSRRFQLASGARQPIDDGPHLLQHLAQTALRL
jgi:hypothetical protein